MTAGGALQLTGARTISWTAKLPEGLTPVEVVFGQDDTGAVGEVQVAVSTATARPTKAMMATAWRLRGANTAMPVLVAAELARPRLRFDARRWATVFPFGMYAAMAFAVGRVEHHRWAVTFARSWVWVALAVWVVVAAASVRHLAGLLGAGRAG